MLDVRVQSSIESAVAEAVQAFGELDMLVNNAAVTLRRDAIDVTREEWRDVMDVNFTGTFFMCQQMAKHLLATKRAGSIINRVGSLSLAQGEGQGEGRL